MFTLSPRASPLPGCPLCTVATASPGAEGPALGPCLVCSLQDACYGHTTVQEPPSSAPKPGVSLPSFIPRAPSSRPHTAFWPCTCLAHSHL